MSTPSGIAWPFRFGANGHVARASGDEKLKANIVAIVLTQVGERVMEPQFGSVGYSQLFRPEGRAMVPTLEALVKRNLERFEPRVAVRSVSLRAAPLGSGDSGVLIEVAYAVRSSEQSATVQIRIGGDQ